MKNHSKLKIYGLCAICFICVLSIRSLHAQSNTATLEGIVTTSSGAPERSGLPGAHVTLPNLETGAITDRNGEFRLTSLPPGEHLVRVTMVGFQAREDTVLLHPDEVTSLTIVLEPATLETGEIVVTASRRSQLIGRVATSMSIVSAEELSSRNVVSLDQALRVTPGVQVTGTQVDIRGSSGFSYGVGSRVLLLVDGVPLMGPDQGSIDFEGLPLSQTRQIEVLKSPGSALYGGGALGGVINLITRDPATDGPETTLQYYTGAYQPVRFDRWKTGWEGAGRYRPMNGLRFGHSWQVSRTFGYWISGLARTDAGYLERSRFRGVEGYAKLGWKVSEPIRISLYTGLKRSEEEEFIYWNGLDDVLRHGPIEGARTPHVVSDRITLLPVFHHRVHPDLEYTLKGRLFGAAFRPLDAEGNIRPSDQHTLGLRYGGEIQINATPANNLELTGGFSYDANWVESEFFVGEDSLTVRRQPEGAFFLQAEMAWNDRLTTTAGLRYDAYQVHTRNTARQFSPKFSLSYSFSEFLIARASFGRGFRVPSVAERFVNNQDFLPLISNITMKPETSTGVEAGLAGTTPVGEQLRLRAEITGFWNHYRDLVEPQFISSENSFQFVNITEARIRGVETTLSLSDFHQHHSLRVSHTWLDPLDVDLDEPLLYRSRHLLQFSGRASVIPWLEAGADFRAASAPERVDTDFSLFVDDADLFPASYVTDVRLRAHGSPSNSRLSLSGSILVNNLFDYYYVERPAYFAPPRNFQVVLEVVF